MMGSGTQQKRGETLVNWLARGFSTFERIDFMQSTKALWRRRWVILFLFGCVASAQQGNQLPQPSKAGWLESWRNTTVSFGVIDRDQLQGEYYRIVGSGIVFAVDPKTAYIVTARHVFYDRDKNWHPSELRIRYGWQDQKSVYAEHGTPIQLRDTSGNDLWTGLPDGSDLAAIAAPSPMMAEQPAAAPALLAKPEEVFEGESIIVLGYPGIVGNEYLACLIHQT